MYCQHWNISANFESLFKFHRYNIKLLTVQTQVLLAKIYSISPDTCCASSYHLVGQLGIGKAVKLKCHIRWGYFQTNTAQSLRLKLESACQATTVLSFVKATIYGSLLTLSAVVEKMSPCG